MFEEAAEEDRRRLLRDLHRLPLPEQRRRQPIGTPRQHREERPRRDREDRDGEIGSGGKDPQGEERRGEQDREYRKAVDVVEIEPEEQRVAAEQCTAQ